MGRLLARIPQLTTTVTHDLEAEGQLVVYDARGAQLVVLNEMAAVVFSLVDGQRSAADIAAFLSESVPGGVPPSCAADVERFLDQMSAHGVVEFADSSP